MSIVRTSHNKNTSNTLVDQKTLLLSLEMLLESDKYRSYNVQFAKKLGSAEKAIILCDMLSFESYLRNERKLVSHEEHGDGLMFYSHTKCWERCAITKNPFLSAIREFIDAGFMEVVKFGIPFRSYYRLNRSAIAKWFFQESFLEEQNRTLAENTSSADNDQENDSTHTYPPVAQNVPLGSQNVPLYIYPIHDPNITNSSSKSGARAPKPPPSENSFIYGIVKIPEKEHKKLIEEFGESVVLDYAESVDLHCKKQGKKYKDYAAAIRSFIKMDRKKKANIPVKDDPVNSWDSKPKMKIDENAKSLGEMLDEWERGPNGSS